jgi:Arc/MetJ-type ribon-helix-helix transcriptional regulator
MKTARTTILMTPEEKAAIEKRAARRGVSCSEYIRLAVDKLEKGYDDDEAELAALVEEMNKAIPRIKASLDQTSKTLRKLQRENDAFFRERGIR